jgi:hypothetical protein
VFLHSLEQRGLGLRRRAIDLVGEQDVGEDGTGVNWMRRKFSASDAASARAKRVFARPGTPSRITWPPASSAMSVFSTTVS